MSDLPWFPIYRREWLESAAVSAMLPEQEGPFFRLLVIAWGDGDVEPSLPADDMQLATLSKLGARWKKFGGLVKAQFVERDGRLYNPKLSAVWLEQCSKHDAAIQKAKNAQAARAAKKRLTDAQGVAPSNASSIPPSTAPGIQILEVPLPLQGKREPASGDAPAPDGARSAVTENGDSHRDYRDTLANREALLRAGVRVPEGPLPPVQTIAENALESQGWADAYREWLAPRADAWLAENAEEAADLERQERAEMMLKPGAQPSPLTLDTLRWNIRRQAAKQLRLPSQAEWIIAQKAQTAGAQS